MVDLVVLDPGLNVVSQKGHLESSSIIVGVGAQQCVSPFSGWKTIQGLASKSKFTKRSATKCLIEPHRLLIKVSYGS